MDALAFLGGFLAGLLLSSVLSAVCIAAGLALAITGYYYFFTNPRVWGDDLPAEFVGLSVFLLLAATCAVLGYLVRRWWLRSRPAAVP